MDIDIFRLEEVDSTNKYLNTLLASEKEVNEWTVVVANDQVAGKGQQGNSWESEKGKNLTFSFVFSPSYIDASKQFVISQAVSLGICDVLDKEHSDFSIKWPNDIYWKDKKVAGILIENTLMGATINTCVVGIGLNVNQGVFISDAPNPVSLSQITGKEYALEAVLSDLLLAIFNRLAQMAEVSLSYKYKSKLFRFDEVALYKEPAGHLFEAKIVDVEENGILVLEDSDGKKNNYFFKEIEFVL